MSLAISSGTRIGPGVALQSGAISTPVTYLPSTLFELDASTYTEGDWIDSTGNGRNGTIQGTVPWYNDAGGSFGFDGNVANKIVVAGTDVLSGAPANASFSVWANIPGNSYYQHIAGWRGGVNFWFLLLSGASTTEARFENGTTWDINMDYSPYYGTWAQTTFVVNAAESYTRLYINGVNVGGTTGPSGNFASGSNLFSLGSNTGNQFAMTGKVGGATAYTAALTDAEVISEFNRTKTRYGL
jgi:hypothetical protein